MKERVGTENLSRRGFLAGLTGGAAVGASGVVSGQNTTSSPPDDQTTTETEQTTTAGGQTATENDTTSPGSQSTTEANQTTEAGGGGTTEEVVVGPGGTLVFEPDELEITPGTTVRWVWDSVNHNIVVGDQPDGADWQGTPGDENQTYDTGYSYTHTFETPGEYHYWCQPHKSAGMIADVIVREPGAGGEASSALPDSALTLGIGATGSLVSVLALAYFFIRFGGDYAEAAD